LRLSKFFFGNIQICDVSGMVLGVMQLHDFCRNDGLQSIVVVGQIWQCVFLAGLHSERLLQQLTASKSEKFCN
jgi:hypothetical protein